MKRKSMHRLKSLSSLFLFVHYYCGCYCCSRNVSDFVVNMRTKQIRSLAYFIERLHESISLRLNSSVNIRTVGISKFVKRISFSVLRG